MIGLELNWLQSLALGLVSGLTEILPVSSQAHQTILLKFFGETGGVPATRLVIHLATFLTVLISIRGQISRIRRQQQLVRTPPRRRSRPIEMTALMDGRIIRTSIVPIVLMLLVYGLTRRSSSLPLLALVSLINAAMLYLPCLLPSADKDSRMVSPLESLYMGLGAGAAAVPGMSPIGTCYTVGVIHGVDKKYMLHLALMMVLIFNGGMVCYDVADIVIRGIPTIELRELVSWGISALSAAAGTVAGTLIALNGLEQVTRKKGMTGFSFYSFGVALFAFILYLVI